MRRLVARTATPVRHPNGIDVLVGVVGFRSSLKILMLAANEAELYPRFSPCSEWDTCAAHAVLKFAGGEIYPVGTEWRRHLGLSAPVPETIDAIIFIFFDCWRGRTTLHADIRMVRSITIELALSKHGILLPGSFAYAAGSYEYSRVADSRRKDAEIEWRPLSTSRTCRTCRRPEETESIALSG